MSLTLRVRNMDRLDNGMPSEFVLNRRGAMIGRATTCDWSLPDPRSYISSRHGEISFRDGFYYFQDISTNGTFLNGAGERMAKGAPHRIADGDLFLIGHYEVLASLTGEAIAALERQEQQAADAAAARAGWSWDAGGTPAPPPPAAGDGWGAVPTNDGLVSGAGGAAAPLGGGWGAPAGDAGWGAPPTPPSSADWGAAPPPPAAEGWGPPPAGAGDGWGAPPAAPAPATPGWAPVAGPSLSAPAPYAGAFASPPSPPASPSADFGNSWAPVPQAPEQRAPSPWDSAQAPVQQSSAWSSAAPDRPPAPTPNDIWGSMENSNVVDWARADFGQKRPENDDPLGLNKPPPSAALPRELPQPPVTAPAAYPQGAAPPVAGGWGAPPPAQPAAPPPVTPPAAPAAPPPRPRESDMTAAAVALAVAAGLRPDQLKQPGAPTIERAGQLMRRLIAGLVVMVEARARAKSQMGAEQTGLEFDGNNPIKFARTPDQALAQLLNAPERGFMAGEKAVEDAFFDLQSHQMATLKAMQGALRATLDRFSPAAIRKRAETGGFLTRLLPGGREATLWHTYEKEFSGVAQGSDEAFMDVFAKEFRRAYEEQSRSRRR